MNKSGQDMDVYYFLHLIQTGINRSLEMLRDQNTLTEIAGEDTAIKMMANIISVESIVTLQFPEKLIDSFWRNSEVANHAKQFHASIFKGV